VPSLEQIIRPFVVFPTTPPVPVITESNDPPPDPVRLSIGIGGSSLSSLSSDVAPVLPPPPASSSAKPIKPTIQYTTLSSSYSLSASWYMTGVVTEKSSSGGDGYDPFGKGGTFF